METKTTSNNNTNYSEILENELKQFNFRKVTNFEEFKSTIMDIDDIDSDHMPKIKTNKKTFLIFESQNPKATYIPKIMVENYSNYKDMMNDVDFIYIDDLNIKSVLFQANKVTYEKFDEIALHNYVTGELVDQTIATTYEREFLPIAIFFILPEKNHIGCVIEDKLSVLNPEQVELVLQSLIQNSIDWKITENKTEEEYVSPSDEEIEESVDEEYADEVVYTDFVYRSPSDEEIEESVDEEYSDDEEIDRMNMWFHSPSTEESVEKID